ncbi:MAG TPA: hypothetical protein VM283_06065, partial [Armatimonadota bacterium]|nr:hypothetical protein [Armatimonadota bacterium]
MMRHPMLVVCLWAGLVACAALPGVGAPDLLPNGDFAAGLSGWHANNAAGHALDLDPEVRCGTKPAVLLLRDPAATGAAGYLESDAITVEPEGVYVLDLQLRTSEVPAGSAAGVTVNFRSSTDAKRQGDVIMAWGRGTGPGPGAALPAGTWDWRPYRCYYRAHSGTDTARLRLYAPPSGSWWVADLHFTRVPVTRNVPYEMTGALPVPNYSSAAEPGFM